jgi:hypothetical protein
MLQTSINPLAEVCFVRVPHAYIIIQENIPTGDETDRLADLVNMDWDNIKI